MAIDFYEEQITFREERNRKPYVGYFSPEGKLVDYNIPLGGNHHDDWRNPVSCAFLAYVSYIVNGTSIEELKKYASLREMIKNNQYPGFDEFVKRGYDALWPDINSNSMEDFLKSLIGRMKALKKRIQFGLSVGIKPNDYEIFEYRLLTFFQNAYKNKRFFEAIQRKITIEDPYEVKRRIEYIDRKCIFSSSQVESSYLNYLKTDLLSFFKDICVEFLGYDSLERFKPDGTPIKIPRWYDGYDFDFLANPRVISSSYPNINERYYNYLIMGWTVHKLPRFYFNEKTGIYEESKIGDFYQSDKEKALEEEIGSVKRLVPIQDRHKYFR